MGPVPIYYEHDEPDHRAEAHMAVSGKNRKTEKRWQFEPGEDHIQVEVPEEERTTLFPDGCFGEYEADLRELEKYYNEDRYLFSRTDQCAPELIPAAECLLDTLDQMLSASVFIFDEYGSSGLRKLAVDLMDRICKDSYAAGEKVSAHVSWMLQQFPEDEILREDLKEIDETFTDFYLEAYGVMIKKKKC